MIFSTKSFELISWKISFFLNLLFIPLCVCIHLFDIAIISTGGQIVTGLKKHSLWMSCAVCPIDVLQDWCGFYPKASSHFFE
jgi:hypothetical protein